MSVAVYISKQDKISAQCDRLHFVHLVDRLLKWISMQGGSQVHKFTEMAQ
jgi:hypothetical protein